MKKKITLSIDEDVYDELQNLPRKVKISEVASWSLRLALKEMKKGKSLTSKEVRNWMDSTSEGKDFRVRLNEHWGPKFDKIEEGLKELFNLSKPSKSKK